MNTNINIKKAWILNKSNESKDEPNMTEIVVVDITNWKCYIALNVQVQH